MGYQTDFIGYLQIEPPLGARERSFINRISGSLLLQESRGSLRVADEDDEVLRELMSGAPRGWSNGTVCPQGCCLSYDGGDKANHMAPWLKFLMATFFVPGAVAEGVDGLSCDHVLNGMVVGLESAAPPSSQPWPTHHASKRTITADTVHQGPGGPLIAGAAITSAEYVEFVRGVKAEIPEFKIVDAALVAPA